MKRSGKLPELNDHQAQGLARLFSPSLPHVISVFSRQETPVLSDLIHSSIEWFARDGFRVLLVESNATFPVVSPLFKWDARKSLASQILPWQDCQVLHAPECQSGNREIVDAARGEFDIVLFDGRYWHEAAVSIADDVPQTIILWVNDDQAKAAYAVLKAMKDSPGNQNFLLVSDGAKQVAQAATRFLKMPFLTADKHDRVWHNCHGHPETSSNTLSGIPDLARYVARILGRRDNEATNTNHARNHQQQQ
jgi:hypothetical protein